MTLRVHLLPSRHMKKWQLYVSLLQIFDVLFCELSKQTDFKNKCKNIIKTF